MRRLVRTVGLRTAKAGCAPNLTLIIADDGRAVIGAVQKKMPLIFVTMSGSELSRLKREPGPLWNWYSVDPKRRDGAPVENISLIALGPADPPRPVSPHAFIASNVTLSRLTEPVRLDITLGFVVIGSSAARGLTIAQLADLGTVAGLSMINPRRLRELHSPSILQVIKGDAHARERISEATEFDVGYLKALYSGDPGYSSEQQATRMAISMTRHRGQ